MKSHFTSEALLINLVNIGLSWSPASRGIISESGLQLELCHCGAGADLENISVVNIATRRDCRKIFKKEVATKLFQLSTHHPLQHELSVLLTHVLRLEVGRGSLPRHLGGGHVLAVLVPRSAVVLAVNILVTCK